jgi:hypothetical protein
MKKKHQKLIRSIVLAIVVVSFTTIFISRCGLALFPVTTIYAYKPILKYRWENRSLVEHFPTAIPEEAKDVKFYYRAGLWQGGTTIELRMEIPGKAFDSIVDKHRSMAKLTLNHLGKPINTRPEEKDSFTPSLYYHTVSRAEIYDEDHIGPLLADYKIFLLHLEGYWNHGKTAGIAVDQTKREIIYWAESW